MALELLAGPYTIVDMATGSNVASISPYAVLWVESRGLIANGSSAQSLIQMDGSACTFADDYSGMAYGLQIINGDPTAPDVGQLWYSAKVSDPGDPVPDYALGRVTRVYDTPAIRSNAPGSLGHFARVHDRYIDVNGSHVRYWPSPTGSDSPEATLTGMSDASWLSWARERGHIWIGGSTGKVVRYDYVNKVASSPVYQLGITSGLVALFYSAKHDVFVSVRQVSTTFYTHVWARTPLPTSLSAPTASPTVAAGRAVTLTTRVLGAHSDPCPNEVVAWALTGEGDLESEFTATDADGYAHNRLVLPVDASGPSVQIDVELAVP